MATSECMYVFSHHSQRNASSMLCPRVLHLKCVSLLTVGRCIADTPGTGAPTAQRSCSGCAGTMSRSWDTPVSGIGATQIGGCVWCCSCCNMVMVASHGCDGDCLRVLGHCVWWHAFDRGRHPAHLAYRDCGTVEFGRPCWRLGSFATPREPEVGRDRQRHVPSLSGHLCSNT